MLAASPRMTYRQLEDFGPYTILRPIAKGGMAELYLARQRGLEGVERTVVIKRILEKYADDEEFITMFLDEARLLAALSHPNIAQVFEVGRVETSFFLAMEYVRGPTLGKLMAAAGKDGGIMPRREALGVGLSIAEALHYVHERRDDVGRPLNIVHRDLNPANVLVSYDGAVKLIDFGIAKAATKVYETRTGVIKGTYGYIAPEQLAGTTPVDRRADVFALGILLYELCVGQHPYDVSDEPNLIDRILEARYRRPRDVRNDIPRDLDRLIASCLSPHPEGRPDDLGEVIDGLARHLGEQGIVPTMLGLSQLTKSAVPDDEGPRPVRPLTAVPVQKRPFGRDPTGTRKVALDRGSQPPEIQPPEIESAAIEPEPAKVTRVSRPPAAPASWSRRGKFATTMLDEDEPLTLETLERDARPTGTDALLDLAGIDDDEPATLARPLDQPPVPSTMGDEEAPTRLMNLVDDALKPPPEPTVTPALRPAKREPARSGLAWIGVGLVAVLCAGGLGVFYAMRTTTPDPAPPQPAAAPDAGAVVPPADPHLLVTSEPEGATVFLEGQQVEGTTPVTLDVDLSVERVWLRVTMVGHHSEERRVSPTIGTAVFRLRPLPHDSGPPDAGPSPDAGVPDAGPPARRRRRRRRR